MYMYVKLLSGDLNFDLFSVPPHKNFVVVNYYHTKSACWYNYKPTIIAIIINSITLLVENLIN